MQPDSIDIVAIVGAGIVSVVAALVCLRFRVWEVEVGRVGGNPIIKYSYSPVIFFVVGGGVASFFGLGYVFRQVFGL